ncbi:reverse transcriptase domain-containing protein [Tanacetum coccineum]
MLVEVGKFTFPADFVILEMEEDSKVPLILGRPFLHTVDAVIRFKKKQLNLRVRTERMIFHIDYAMKHSYSNDDTCFSIDVIDEILEEDFDALLEEGSEILHSIEGTILEEKLFAEFDEFIAMTTDENSESESDTEEPPFEKITFNTNYKIKTSLEEPPTDIELKPLPDNLEYVFLEELFFLHVIISSQLSEEDKNTLISVHKKHNYFPKHCKDVHLVLNWEKCHFMVKEGILLGHKVSEAGLEVDKAKIEVTSKLSPPTNIKECHNAFKSLKEKLTCAPVITIVHTDHSALRHLFRKQDAKPCLIRWILLLQEFDIEIKDRKGTKNVAADHLSRIENEETSDDSEVDDNFPGETLMEIDTEDKPWFADFANYLIMENTMKRYGVNHRFSTSYHHQTSGQVENTDRALQRILEKTVKDNPAIWSRKLNNALWAFRIAYKTPTGTTPYKLIYGKNCHLQFKIEHRAYWALKNCNPDLIAAGEKQMF